MAQCHPFFITFVPMEKEAKFCCAKCGKEFRAQTPMYVSVERNPEMKQEIISGKLFIKECPYCGNRQIIRFPLVYVDTAASLLIYLSESSAINIDDPAGFTCRLVSDAGSLIEKIKIFDAGLDDIAIEMCKFVTLQELGKQVELKFFKLEGAEGDMIFTYPEKGEMQMLSVGLNVYEDCRKILRRNPSIEEGAKGLVKIDRDWLSTFLA